MAVAFVCGAVANPPNAVALLAELFAAIPIATDCVPCPPCAALEPMATELAP